MVHMRIVVPNHACDHVLDLLEAAPAVTNLIYLPGRRESRRAT